MIKKNKEKNIWLTFTSVLSGLIISAIFWTLSIKILSNKLQPPYIFSITILLVFIWYKIKQKNIIDKIKNYYLNLFFHSFHYIAIFIFLISIFLSVISGISIITDFEWMRVFNLAFFISADIGIIYGLYTGKIWIKTKKPTKIEKYIGYGFLIPLLLGINLYLLPYYFQKAVLGEYLCQEIIFNGKLHNSLNADYTCKIQNNKQINFSSIGIIHNLKDNCEYKIQIDDKFHNLYHYQEFCD